MDPDPLNKPGDTLVPSVSVGLGITSIRNGASRVFHVVPRYHNIGLQIRSTFRA